MSSPASVSEDSCSSDNSELNFTDYELEAEESAGEESSKSNDQQDGELIPYADEPLADEEWITNYRQERKKTEDRRRDLQNRLEGLEPRESWCSCGKCKIDLLQNAYECQCCREIEKCVEANSSDLVLQDVETPPICITLHPGFHSVCLDKWSLRLAAGKYKTKDKRRYRQTGTEEAFLRVVSYREYIQLVYGYLGNNRIPLPACAYDAIRTKFYAEKEPFTGFEEDEDENTS